MYAFFQEMKRTFAPKEFKELYICIIMAQVKDRVSVPVSLPIGLVNEIDKLVECKMFSSRSEVLRFGARLALTYHLRLHEMTEEVAYEEVIRRLERGGRGNVS